MYWPIYGQTKILLHVSQHGSKEGVSASSILSHKFDCVVILFKPRGCSCAFVNHEHNSQIEVSEALRITWHIVMNKTCNRVTGHELYSVFDGRSGRIFYIFTSLELLHLFTRNTRPEVPVSVCRWE